jgi:hypothetical protein
VDARHDVLAQPFGKHQRHAGLGDRDVIEQHRHQHAPDRRRHAEPDDTARRRRQVVDLAARALGTLDHRPGVVGHQPARLGRRDAAGMAMQQLGAELILQLADLHAESRLRDVQRRRRRGEASGLDDLGEVSKLAEFHGIPSGGAPNINRTYA